MQFFPRMHVYMFSKFTYSLTDPCSSNPCQNGGTCVNVENGTFSCKCPVLCPCVDMGHLCQRGMQTKITSLNIEYSYPTFDNTTSKVTFAVHYSKYRKDAHTFYLNKK